MIQNNGYAISVPQDVQTGSSIHQIAAGYGVPSIALDGKSFDAIHSSVPAIIERIRRGDGPALVEASVIRMDPHSSSDDQRKYRSADELERLAALDPIATTESELLDRGVLTAAQVQSLRAGVKAEVDEAADLADAAPAPSARGLLAHIYAGDPSIRAEVTSPQSVSSEPITLIDAINHGLREEMQRNPKSSCGAKTSQIPKAAYSESRAA